MHAMSAVTQLGGFQSTHTRNTETNIAACSAGGRGGDYGGGRRGGDFGGGGRYGALQLTHDSLFIKNLARRSSTMCLLHVAQPGCFHGNFHT